MSTKTVLIVDGDDEALELGKMILENLGYEALATGDSALALAWWREKEPDLVIFNPFIHLRDGHVLHRVVRGDPLLRTPKLAYLVEEGEFSDLKKQLGVPSTLILTKPLEFEALMTRVTQLIGPAHDD